MRSRSILLHDSHLLCSINHHERTDTRAPQQIKSLSIISAYIALIMAFLRASWGGKITTKPHGEGIGLRYGISSGQSRVVAAHDTDGTAETQTGVAAWDAEINAESNPRFPVFYQFEESLLTNWLGHKR